MHLSAWSEGVHVLMLPKITDRSETYSSHLKRLIKEQSLTATLDGNWESAPLGSPGERLCWHLPPLRNKLKMLPCDHSMEMSKMLSTSPARNREECAHSTVKLASCAACGSGAAFPACAGALHGCWPGAASTHTVLQQSRWDHSQHWEVCVLTLIIRQSGSPRIKTVIKLEIGCGFPKSCRCWQHFEAQALSGSAQYQEKKKSSFREACICKAH